MRTDALRVTYLVLGIGAWLLIGPNRAGAG